MPANRTPCPTTNANDETVLWLCHPSHRNISAFLDSIHTWYHEHRNTLTEAQRQGVERWRQRRDPNVLATPRCETVEAVNAAWREYLDENGDDWDEEEYEEYHARFYMRRGWTIDSEGELVQMPSAMPDEPELRMPPVAPEAVPDGEVLWQENPEVARIELTPAQARRLIEGDLVSPIDARSITAVPIEPGLPAVADLRHTVLNGFYSIRSGVARELYKIYTITYSRTNPDLVGKRVIARYVGGEYRNFAYLTADGSVKLWRRYERDENEQYVVYARQLVRILMDDVFGTRQGINQSIRTFHFADGMNASWEIEVTDVLCRRCNRVMEDRHYISHDIDNCDVTGTGTPPRPRRTRMPRPTYGNGARVETSSLSRTTSYSQPREVHTMSEVTGDWEQ